MPLDRERLVKALQRTRGTGTTDAEKIAAIDAANAMLSRAGIDWTGLISGSRAKVKVGGDAPSFVRSSHNVSLVDALAEIKRAGDWTENLESISRLWQRSRVISPGDRKMIYGLYEKLGSPGNEEPE